MAIQNINGTSRVKSARKDSGSLRVTIPEMIAKFYAIKDGDEFTWSVIDEHDIKITIKRTST